MPDRDALRCRGIGRWPGKRRGRAYDRARDLPRLLPLLADELDVRTLAQHVRLVALLRRALRSERRRGLAGDWCYDLARHAALLAAYRRECALLDEASAAMRGGAGPAGSTGMASGRTAPGEAGSEAGPGSAVPARGA